MNLLDLLAPEDGGTGLADHQPVTHIITPDMATLCRDDYLEASARGDRLRIAPHRDGIGWRAITCPWCRSLGHTYYRRACDLMQGRQATAA